MNGGRESAGLAILGAPLLSGAVVFLVGAACGFILSESEILDTSSNTILYFNAEEEDNNRDGKTDSWYVYRGSNLARSRHDRNFDGEADLWFIYRKGVTVRSEADHNFDGEVDDWSLFRDREVYQSKVDTDYNGVPDATWTFDMASSSGVSCTPMVDLWNGSRNTPTASAITSSFESPTARCVF